MMPSIIKMKSGKKILMALSDFMPISALIVGNGISEINRYILNISPVEKEHNAP
jgi:hypothetical protein